MVDDPGRIGRNVYSSRYDVFTMTEMRGWHFLLVNHDNERAFTTKECLEHGLGIPTKSAARIR